jgi:hypothetical protein
MENNFSIWEWTIDGLKNNKIASEIIQKLVHLHPYRTETELLSTYYENYKLLLNPLQKKLLILNISFCSIPIKTFTLYLQINQLFLGICVRITAASFGSGNETKIGI